MTLATTKMRKAKGFAILDVLWMIYFWCNFQYCAGTWPDFCFHCVFFWEHRPNPNRYIDGALRGYPAMLVLQLLDSKSCNIADDWDVTWWNPWVHSGFQLPTSTCRYMSEVFSIVFTVFCFRFSKAKITNHWPTGKGGIIEAPPRSIGPQ